MKSRLQNWWQDFPLGEAASLLFWNLTIVGFVVGAVWMARRIQTDQQTSTCAELYRVTDPGVNVVLFLQDLEQQGLFDPKSDMVHDYAWVYNGGELRFMVQLDSGVYSAVACYSEDGAHFEDLQQQ